MAVKISRGSPVNPAAAFPPTLDWPQTERPSAVFRHGLWQPISPPLRYAPAKMLANITDTSQVTKSGTGTMSNDTTDMIAGPASVICLASGGNSTTTYRAPVNASTFDLTAGVNVIRLPLKLYTNTWDTSAKQWTRFTSLKLQISSDGFSSGNFHEVTIANVGSNWHVNNRWCWMGWNASDFTAAGSGATLTAINCVRLSIQAGGSAGDVQISWGPVFVCPIQATKAMAVISFDDGYATGFTEGAKRMMAYGFPGVLFPNPKQIGWTEMRIADFEKLRDFHGWQIASHQWSSTEHNQHEEGLTLEQQWGKIRAWQQAMGAQRGADDYAWSGSLAFLSDGTYDTALANGVHYHYQDHWDQVRKNFRTARTTYAKAGSVESCPPVDPHRIRCWLWGADVWNGGSFATDPKLYVDRVIGCKGLAYFCIHNTIGSDPTDTTNFDTLLAYLDSNRATIDTVTLDTAIARMNALA